ncbi:hypothetical protein [Oceanicaulis sp. MMSF_3324]|uniref:hypothetical protein n=1 Tax=Oceanicaulis sp. MMSF_3324 TaxID=3046702 RepID=UPI00273F11C6|nr:hypothetical protein [Oceanicaulis sp. MMSF_3324]
MVKLARGQAPGLAAGRPSKDGTPVWRWTPGASQRKRGLKAINQLRGEGGEQPFSNEDWIAKGFTHRPAELTLSHDGPLLDQLKAAKACQAIAAAARGQGAPLTDQAAADTPTPPRRRPARTLNDCLDLFEKAGRAGKILKRDKRTGQRVAVSQKTMSGYISHLVPIRRALGMDAPYQIRRGDVVVVLDTLSHEGKHSMAVAAATAWTRAMNWLALEAGINPALLPPPNAYKGLGMGQKPNRQRLALPEEAEAMYQALAEPQRLTLELGLHPDDAPAAHPSAAAAWRTALWTAQRGVDTLSFNDHAFRSDRLLWRQSKTGSRINIPILDPLREAVQLARAARSGIVSAAELDRHDGLLFWNNDTGKPYRQVKQKTGEVYYKDFNEHWNAARKLAGRKVPSLIGEGVDGFGEPNKPLWFLDSRDTAVTRLFEAMAEQDGALASIAMWWGGDSASVEDLLKVLRNYLVLNPSFADKAGTALSDHANKLGFAI